MGGDRPRPLLTFGNQRVTLGWDKFINRQLYVSPVFFEYFRDPRTNPGRTAIVVLEIPLDILKGRFHR